MEVGDDELDEAGGYGGGTELKGNGVTVGCAGEEKMSCGAARLCSAAEGGGAVEKSVWRNVGCGGD